MQRQAPTPSHHCFLQALTYKRLLPQFCKLQLARKLQLPSIFCRHQLAGGSNLGQLQLTATKLQLDREAPTYSIYQPECLLIYLRYQLYSAASRSALLFFIFSASIFYTLHSLYLLSLSPLAVFLFSSTLLNSAAHSLILSLYFRNFLPLDITLFYTK